MNAQNKERKALFALAIPMILSNITVPLLGLVDTGVIGHLDQPYYLGATARREKYKQSCPQDIFLNLRGGVRVYWWVDPPIKHMILSTVGMEGRAKVPTPYPGKA